MLKLQRRWFCVFLVGIAAEFVVPATDALAQSKPTENSSNEIIDEDLSLADLMNMKVSLPTRVAQQADEAPSIVSVISRQDIERYGARDVADVLRLVPGFEFGIDVFGLVGASQRGIWAHEGKALVMINGVVVNDLSFGNVNYFGSYPAAMIERVEVIRGPGSAVYGGFAEVAVINIITRSGAAMHGVEGSLNAGAMHSEPTWGGNIGVGMKTDDIDLSFHVGRTKSPWSARPFKDFFGGETKLGYEESPRDWKHFVASAVYKNALKLRFVHTEFDFGGSNTFGMALPPQPFTDMSGHYSNGLQLSYDWKASERLSIEPLVEYINGDMGNVARTPRANEFAAPYSLLERYRAEVSANYRLTEKGLISAGAGYWRDRVNSISASGAPGLQLTDGSTVYTTYADSKFAYAQYIENIGPFGVTLGGRYDSTSFGDAFAPRVGVVIHQGRLATKLLYGRAFRIPLVFQAYSRVENIAEGGLKPETSDTSELQLIYSWTRNIKSRVNMFFTRVEKPLTFVVDRYENFGEISSLGAEGELEIRYENYGGFLNASYAQPGPNTSRDFVTVDNRHFLAMAALKLNGGGYYRAGDFEFGPSFTLLSKRFGQSQESATSSEGLISNSGYPVLFLANLAVTWHEVIKNSSVQLSVHNAFDAPYQLISPFYGAHAPLPAHDREIRLQFRTSL